MSPCNGGVGGEDSGVVQDVLEALSLLLLRAFEEMGVIGLSRAESFSEEYGAGMFNGGVT